MLHCLLSSHASLNLCVQTQATNGVLPGVQRSKRLLSACQSPNKEENLLGRGINHMKRRYHFSHESQIGSTYSKLCRSIYMIVMQ